MASSFNRFRYLHAILQAPLKCLSDSALDAEITKIIRTTWLRIGFALPTKLMNQK